MTLPNRMENGERHQTRQGMYVRMDRYSFERGDWYYQVWSDGSRIVQPADSLASNMIERVAIAGHPRVQWHIVIRDGTEPSDLEPPIVAGPFATLRGAQVALKVLGPGDRT